METGFRLGHLRPGRRHNFNHITNPSRRDFPAVEHKTPRPVQVDRELSHLRTVG